MYMAWIEIGKALIFLTELFNNLNSQKLYNNIIYIPNWKVYLGS